MNYVPNYYNPLEEHNKMMEESIKRAQDMLKNQESLFEEGKAPMDHIWNELTKILKTQSLHYKKFQKALNHKLIPLK